MNILRYGGSKYVSRPSFMLHVLCGGIFGMLVGDGQNQEETWQNELVMPRPVIMGTRAVQTFLSKQVERCWGLLVLGAFAGGLLSLWKDGAFDVENGDDDDDDDEESGFGRGARPHTPLSPLFPSSFETCIKEPEICPCEADLHMSAQQARKDILALRASVATHYV